MWIHLLRHGTAEDLRPGLADDDRELTDEGRGRLRRAAPAWAKLVRRPDVVLTSPLVRARQTAEVLVAALGGVTELRVVDELVPHGAPALAVALLEGELLSGTGSVAVVGHEPHLGHLLGALLTGSPRSAVPLKKGMLVGVETTSPTSVVGQLRFALSQKDAARLA